VNARDLALTTGCPVCVHQAATSMLSQMQAAGPWLASRLRVACELLLLLPLLRTPVAHNQTKQP
jgi:hypothetical protein